MRDYNVFVTDFSKLSNSYKQVVRHLLPEKYHGDSRKLDIIPDDYKMVNETKVRNALRNGKKRITGLRIVKMRST